VVRKGGGGKFGEARGNEVRRRRREGGREGGRRRIENAQSACKLTNGGRERYGTWVYGQHAERQYGTLKSK